MERKQAELAELYVQHAQYLNKFMLRLTRNREEAADLVQEVFVRLCLQDRLPEHAKEWMALTGYRLFVDQWRRRKRTAGLRFEPIPFAQFVAPEQAALDREFESAIQGLLLRFKLRKRTALYMRLYKQAGSGEISRLLDYPENTVKSDIHRGKRQLSEWLLEDSDVWRTNVRKKCFSTDRISSIIGRECSTIRSEAGRNGNEKR